MSESKSEIVSMLVDNFKPSDELLTELSLNELAKDNELSSTWQRYHLIGDIMRDETAQALQLNLSDKISAAIAEETTILSPSTSVKNNDNTSSLKAKVVQLFKPVGQFAIAASAAGLMIVSVQQNTAETENVMPSQVVQTVPLAGFANPVSFNMQPSSQPNAQSSKLAQKQAYVDQYRRFQALLSDYQQQQKLTTVAKNVDKKEMVDVVKSEILQNKD